MQPQLLELEKRAGLGPVATARLLGYPYATYAQYRSGRREVKPYLRQHIAVLMLLPASVLAQLIKDQNDQGKAQP